MLVILCLVFLLKIRQNCQTGLRIFSRCKKVHKIKQTEMFLVQILNFLSRIQKLLRCSEILYLAKQVKTVLQMLEKKARGNLHLSVVIQKVS